MNNVIDKLKIPSIGLLISGIVGKENLPTHEGERIGYLAGTFGGYGLALISLLVAPVIVIGAIKMMKGKSRGLAFVSAIFSILPVTSCCFFVSIIFGVWALVILFQPDVKEFFQNGGEANL
jgi:hypothetical protein